jgi:hypothetical protein
MNFLAGVLLLLCLAVASLWVRGRWVWDAYIWETPQTAAESWGWQTPDSRQFGVMAEDGRFTAWVGPALRQRDLLGYLPLPVPDGPAGPDDVFPGEGASTFVGFFYWQQRTLSSETRTCYYGVPYWAIVALTAPMPLVRAARWLRRRRRTRLGLCPKCSYDIRATPDRCPECGHTPMKVESRA